MSDTPIADMVEQMLSTGCRVDDMLLAIRTAERCIPRGDAAAERRRAWDRNRKAEERAKKEASECPPESGGHDIYKKELLTTIGSKKVSKRVAREMPVGWNPVDRDREYALAKGWSDSKIDHEAERFRNHAQTNARKCKNWSAAWRNWVTSPYQGQINGQQPKTQSDGLVAAGQRRLAELAEIRRRLELDESEVADGGLRSGNADVRLLPTRGRSTG